MRDRLPSLRCRSARWCAASSTAAICWPGLGRPVAADDEHGLWLWVADRLAPIATSAPPTAGRSATCRSASGAGPRRRCDELHWGGDMLMLHPRDGAYSLWLFFDARRHVPRLVREPGGAGGPVARRRPGRRRHSRLRPRHRGRARPDAGGGRTRTSSRRTWPTPTSTGSRRRAAVRAEGERLVKLTEAGEFPFDGTMTDFRPDPGWPVPARPCRPAGTGRAPGRPGRRRHGEVRPGRGPAPSALAGRADQHAVRGPGRRRRRARAAVVAAGGVADLAADDRAAAHPRRGRDRPDAGRAARPPACGPAPTP